MCTQSEFFAAACRWPNGGDSRESKRRRTSGGRFVSGSSLEQDQNTSDENRVIYLEEDDPIAVWAMVRYLYHLSYPPPTDRARKEILGKGQEAEISDSEGEENKRPVKSGDRIAARSWSCVHRHARIYSLAEKYGIPGLKRFAGNAFGDSLINSHGKTGRFASCVREVYTGTPEHDRELRDHMKKHLRKKIHYLKYTDVENILLEIPRAAVDVLMTYNENPKTQAKAR